MERNEKLGGIVALIGGLMGIIGHFTIFLNWYHRGMAAEAAEPGCEILLKWIHPALTDVGILGGVIFLVSAYGFFTKQKWAFILSVIAIVLSLQGAWFINVPFMAAGLPPVYFTLFWPFLILYFLIMVPVGKLSWKRTMVGFLAGMAWVFCLMNGIASLSRIITIGAPFFSLVQRSHWVAMLGWGVFTVGFLDAAQRMDASGWSHRRRSGTGRWNPTGDHYCSGIGTIFALLPGTDLLPDPGYSARVARGLGKNLF